MIVYAHTAGEARAEAKARYGLKRLETGVRVEKVTAATAA